MVNCLPLLLHCLRLYHHIKPSFSSSSQFSSSKPSSLPSSSCFCHIHDSQLFYGNCWNKFHWVPLPGILSFSSALHLPPQIGLSLSICLSMGSNSLLVFAEPNALLKRQENIFPYQQSYCSLAAVSAWNPFNSVHSQPRIPFSGFSSGPGPICATTQVLFYLSVYPCRHYNKQILTKLTSND